MNLNWDTKEKIGQGGNAIVYKIQDYGGKYYAVKVSKCVQNNKAYKRFQDEVAILTKLNGREGIMPILFTYLPETVSKNDPAYFVMPMGETINKFIWGKTPSQLINLLIKLSRVLADLHDQKIAHRDIKPDNILVIDNQPVFSDFGLAYFPKKANISGIKEKIGAKWTIAPEMERISSSSEFQKADVYSFAKTVYILITKQSLSFEGQYIPKSSISLDNFVSVKINDSHQNIEQWDYNSIASLEELLVDATNNDPKRRPSAIDFTERLTEWFNASFRERNYYEWKHCLSRIFPFSIPESAVWSKLSEIESILKLLANEYDMLNYSFCPDFGGIDFQKIDYAHEENCLIINDYIIVKPKKLIFEFMDNFDCSYFQLELDNLQPIFFENQPKEFLSLDRNNNYQNDNPLDRNFGRKPIVRYLQGSFIITRKTSILNELRGNYDGHFALHKNRSIEGYKQLVLEISVAMQNGAT